jgi:hypothetical protein
MLSRGRDEQGCLLTLDSFIRDAHQQSIIGREKRQNTKQRHSFLALVVSKSNKARDSNA